MKLSITKCLPISDPAYLFASFSPWMILLIWNLFISSTLATLEILSQLNINHISQYQPLGSKHETGHHLGVLLQVVIGCALSELHPHLRSSCPAVQRDHVQE